jgi:hypothetical protein
MLLAGAEACAMQSAYQAWSCCDGIAAYQSVCRGLHLPCSGGRHPLPVVCPQDPGSATAVGQPQYLRTRSERWTHAARSHVCWRLGGFPVVLVVDRELVVVV